MGLKDTVTTKYMKQNEIFADVCNYFIYNGEQVIKSDSLEELDTREVDVPYGGLDGAKQPVKNMVYDALQYAKQVSNAIASHKRSGDYKEADGDKYLSGFMKQDRLLPVVTLVVYFDSKEWAGPMSIRESMYGDNLMNKENSWKHMHQITPYEFCVLQSDLTF